LNYGSRPPFNKRSKESLIFYEMKIDPLKNKKYFKLKIKNIQASLINIHIKIKNIFFKYYKRFYLYFFVQNPFP
jgi:hypothetical protein